MTAMQIMALALRQLDELPEDIAEFRDMFLPYLNEGYDIAVRQFLKPRRHITLYEDRPGLIPLDDPRITRVVELRGAHGMIEPFALSADGRALMLYSPRPPERPKLARKRSIPKPGEPLPPEAFVPRGYDALCEVGFLPLVRDEDEPRIDPVYHPSLADYICYKHLGNGNLAKQSRAVQFQQRFYQQMGRIRPDGFRSVTHEHGLYAASDIRWPGGD